MREEGDMGTVVSVGKKSKKNLASFSGAANKKKDPLTFARVFGAF